jgi:phosphodiesterase/alkaline phosphatase D-like protein
VRASEGGLRPVAPSFARAGGYEVLADPFRERLRVVHGEPGDAELSTRLTLMRGAARVLVHWEVARDARFSDVERYGLFFAHAQLDYQVRVALTGLSPGRGYWARMWAGGSWSATVRVHTESLRLRSATPRWVAARPVSTGAADL